LSFHLDGVKALVYILIIAAALFTGFLMSNTFFRAHYLGIGQKINFNLTLREQECSFGECVLIFSDDLDPYFMYLIPWSNPSFEINSSARVLMVKNEFGQIFLISLFALK
jgi:hypothetical protein